MWVLNPVQIFQIVLEIEHFQIPKKRFTQLWQNTSFYIAFQLTCVQQMLTNDDSTKISYDIAYVFSLDRLEIPDIA